MDLLQEAKQVGILYHYTDVLALKSIAKTMSLIPGFGNNFVSFSRKGNGISGWGSSGNARLIINGNILSNFYKIKPIQFIKKSHLAEERIYSEKVDIRKSLIAIEILDTTPEIEFLNIKKLYSNYEVNVVKGWKSYKN